ncbi:hypothetical protein EBB79_11545 [Parasedimentitalea marina]|uniref:Uncharacterized protein n=1 Tax=Parasedimentitalea marina TaxID=2483033 RepID=A0A3T0N397_9RHOB|nr:hypothetical protein EBB79_11545 [Parasedimentitalea marina]
METSSTPKPYGYRSAWQPSFGKYRQFHTLTFPLPISKLTPDQRQEPSAMDMQTFLRERLGK